MICGRNKNTGGDFHRCWHASSSPAGWLSWLPPSRLGSRTVCLALVWRLLRTCGKVGNNETSESSDRRTNLTYHFMVQTAQYWKLLWPAVVTWWPLVFCIATRIWTYMLTSERLQMGWYHLWHASLLFKATFKPRKYWSTLANLWPHCSRSNTFEWSPHNIFNLTLCTVLQRPVHVRFSRNMDNGALIFFFWAICHSPMIVEKQEVLVHQFMILGSGNLASLFIAPTSNHCFIVPPRVRVER